MKTTLIIMLAAVTLAAEEKPKPLTDAQRIQWLTIERDYIAAKARAAEAMAALDKAGAEIEKLAADLRRASGAAEKCWPDGKQQWQCQEVKK